MKILVVGGGSGGHVTPAIAVIQQVKKLNSTVKIHFWCDKKFSHQARDMFEKNGLSSIKQSTVVAGKFRRYHNLSVIYQLLHPSIGLRNVLDLFKVLIGFVQSFVKLIFWRPNVIFAKGGFVCLPVGLAGWLLRIPIVIHDSDTHPGLTNRILAKFARGIATGSPLKFYNYPAAKSRYTGIPISEEFTPFSEDKKTAIKKKLELDADKPLVVVTGGGLGAQAINNSVMANLPELLKKSSVILIAGKENAAGLKSQVPANSRSFKLYGFVSDGMVDMLGAADVVVTRAGATTLVELAALAKATIIIPNERLVAGHQTKNANVYKDAGAVVVVKESDLESQPGKLLDAIESILKKSQKTKAMEQSFYSFARPNAARDVAEMIVLPGGSKKV